MKKWEVQSELRSKNQELRPEEIIDLLLKNRGITTKEEQEEFLHPQLEDVTIESVGIDKKQLRKAVIRIKKAIEEKEQIVVFGDYDVDGICGAAVLWETLYVKGALVVPYIPHRVDEGYGLSVKGISNIKSQISNISLIITVDNGIAAHEAVKFANEQGIDVIITDHHLSQKTKPDAYAIVHTTKLCGTGVGWMLSNEFRIQNSEFKINIDDHLALVAMATVADCVPLTGANRTVTKFGLEQLRKSNRIGLLSLFKEAGIEQKTIDTYHIGHIIAPRLNAMGRLEYAMDSLRLLCTKNAKRAQELAFLLGSTNKQRQELTEETLSHARLLVTQQGLISKKLLFVAHESYQQGVIGLIAGRLLEEHYKPTIVLSIGEEYTKASARSITGFNISEFILSASQHLVNGGGHPMAAGFTIETAKLSLLRELLEKKAEEMLTPDLLTRTLKIDMELPFPCIDTSLHTAVQHLAPYGIGNPEPVFVSKNVVIEDIRLLGQQRQHVKFKVKQQQQSISAIAFRMAEKFVDVKSGDAIDIAYTIDMNEWNGRKSLQLKIKDIKVA